MVFTVLGSPKFRVETTRCSSTIYSNISLIKKGMFFVLGGCVYREGPVGVVGLISVGWVSSGFGASSV